MDIILGFILLIAIIAVPLVIYQFVARGAEKASTAASHSIARKKGEKLAQEKAQARTAQMRKILDSPVFKDIEKKIFPDGQCPVRIDWNPFSDKRVKVFLNNTAYVDIYISDTEIPDVIDFMRALNYKYGSKYNYEENSSSDSYPDSNGEYHDKRWVNGATLTLRKEEAVKVNSQW